MVIPPIPSPSKTQPSCVCENVWTAGRLCSGICPLGSNSCKQLGCVVLWAVCLPTSTLFLLYFYFARLITLSSLLFLFKFKFKKALLENELPCVSASSPGPLRISIVRPLAFQNSLFSRWTRFLCYLRYTDLSLQSRFVSKLSEWREDTAGLQSFCVTCSWSSHRHTHTHSGLV